MSGIIGVSPQDRTGVIGKAHDIAEFTGAGPQATDSGANLRFKANSSEKMALFGASNFIGFNGNDSQGRFFSQSGTSSISSDFDVDIPILAANRSWLIFAYKGHVAGGWHSCIFQYACRGNDDSTAFSATTISSVLPVTTSGNIIIAMPNDTTLQAQFVPQTGGWGAYAVTYLVWAYVI